MNATHNSHDTLDGRQRPVTNWLHPRVYAILITLTAWFALAVWSFAGRGVVNYVLFIVSSFIFVTTAAHRHPVARPRTGDAAAHDDKQQSLRDWAASDYDTRTGRLSGAQAATQILLPIAAAAVGMTVIGILFQIAEHAAA